MKKLAYTSQFKRDLKHAEKIGRDILLLNHLVTMLRQNARLALHHRDHSLSGNWKDHRECHINPDWLLIYQSDEETITLVRTGSHTELL